MLNIFEYHETPEVLNMYGVADINIPEFFYEKYHDNIKELEKRKNVIMKSPKYAYDYARRVIKGRWPEAEKYIMEDPNYIYRYALNVIRGRWHEAEPIIMKDPEAAFLYAVDVIEGRWPEAEKYIMKASICAVFSYAKEILKRPWPEVESYIMEDEFWWEEYKSFLEELNNNE